MLLWSKIFVPQKPKQGQEMREPRNLLDAVMQLPKVLNAVFLVQRTALFPQDFFFVFDRSDSNTWAHDPFLSPSFDSDKQAWVIDVGIPCAMSSLPRRLPERRQGTGAAMYCFLIPTQPQLSQRESPISGSALHAASKQV